MRELSHNKIPGIEFPDCKVLAFSAREDRLAFTCDGIYIDSEGFIDAKSEVIVDEWKSAKIIRFDAHGANGVELPLSRSGQLHEICQCSFEEHEVKLAGFETDSGLWQEYHIKSPRIRVYIDQTGPQ